MFAKLIAIDAPDKYGKNTQCKFLAHSLKLYGDKVKLFEIPFNDKMTFKVIYSMLRSGKAKTHPNLFQFVQFLNKFLFQVTFLLFAWLTCSYVVLDRWKLSTIVYGDATGANKLFTRFLCFFLVNPKKTILLIGRSYERNTISDTYENDASLQRKVTKLYSDYYCRNFMDDESLEIVGNTGTKDEVHKDIKDIVSTL